MRVRPLAIALMLLPAFVLADDSSPKPNDESLGAKPPEGAVVLFDGKDLSGWVGRGDAPAEWPVKHEHFSVGPGKGDIYTKDKFGDYQLHVEFNIPLMPDAHGQGRGNSGVYQTGNYELQVLDSYGLKPQNNDCSAIYQQVVPAYNACKPPLQWQTYDITFRAPRFGADGSLVQKPRATVYHNDILIHDNDSID